MCFKMYSPSSMTYSTFSHDDVLDILDNAFDHVHSGLLNKLNALDNVLNDVPGDVLNTTETHDNI